MMTVVMSGDALLQFIGGLQDQQQFRQLNWTGSFADYLNIVDQNPKVTRNAFQRIYDMVISYGTEEFIDAKKRLIVYRFFSDSSFDADDAIFGLEIPLMRLVNFFQSAAQGYGTEKRVLLLHGPVGSAKSTIVRRIKRGLELYSRSPEGALYSFSWYMGDIAELEAGRVNDTDWEPSPMNEEPLCLVPQDLRPAFLERLNKGRSDDNRVQIKGNLCPVSRYNYHELMRRYDGDWNKMIRHVRVRRLLFSEQDRIGIGTFQPKDEKNQDSTELTGDINYRKIAVYGSDSDRVRLALMASLTLPIVALSSLSRCSSLMLPSCMICWALHKSIKLNRRSLPRLILMRSSLVIPMSQSIGVSKITSLWRR